MNDLENQEIEIVECAYEQNTSSGKHEVHGLEQDHGDVELGKEREDGVSDIDDMVVDDSDAADELDSPVSDDDESTDQQEHDVEEDNGNMELKEERGGGESDYDAVADDSNAEGDIDSPISDDDEETEVEVDIDFFFE